MQSKHGRINHSRWDAWVTRRHVLGGAAASGAATALASCGMPGERAPQAEAKEVTVTYMTDWNEGARAEYLKQAMPKFTEENPQIKVHVVNATGDSKQVALANSAAGTLADSMLAGGDLPLLLARNGDMKDIAPVLKSLKIKMDDVVHTPSSIMSEGKQFGMPFQFVVHALVVNKTMFTQRSLPLPTDKTTYPQLLETVSKLARPSESIYGLGTDRQIFVWAPYVWGWGGEVISKDLKKTLLDEPPAREAFQVWMDAMYRTELATPLDDKGGWLKGVDFANGNVAVAPKGSPGAALDKQVAGKFEWEVMYHPLGPKTGKRMVAVADAPNIVSGQAAKHGQFDQAVKLVAWLSASKAAQDLMLEIGPNAWPVLKSVLNSPKYLAGPPPAAKVLVDQIPSFREIPNFVGQLEWRNEMQNALLQAFSNQKSMPDATRDAARAGDVVLAKYAK